MPGYGYAQVSKQSKKTFQKFITDYFKKRKELVCAFVLVDIRLEPQKIDLEFMQWLGENLIPFSIIFTKADKLTEKSITDNIDRYKKKLLENWEDIPPFFITSSENKTGRIELLTYIEEINSSLKEKNIF